MYIASLLFHWMAFTNRTLHTHEAWITTQFSGSKSLFAGIRPHFLVFYALQQQIPDLPVTESTNSRPVPLFTFREPHLPQLLLHYNHLNHSLFATFHLLTVHTSLSTSYHSTSLQHQLFLALSTMLFSPDDSASFIVLSNDSCVFFLSYRSQG
jgi:hypothetical protein